MQCKMTHIALLMGITLVAASALSLAQEHDQPGGQNRTGASASVNEGEAIFCPAMKTGQLCSHGTANVLRLNGEKKRQWIRLARKYNKAVNAATEQLFQDAKGTLTPDQLRLLKAWFAVGLNPEINQLLYNKGLGPQDTGKQ